MAAEYGEPRVRTRTWVAGVLSAVAKERSDSVSGAWRQALADYGATQVASLTGCGRSAAKEIAAALTSAGRAILAYGAGACDDEAMAHIAALPRLRRRAYSHGCTRDNR